MIFYLKYDEIWGSHEFSRKKNNIQWHKHWELEAEALGIELDLSHGAI